MEAGYIKVHRSLFKKGYYTHSQYVHLWIHLLMRATWCEREILLDGEIRHLKPGQFICSRKSLSKETGIQQSKIERILSLFESEHQIEQQATNKYRCITITNWDRFQESEQQNEQQNEQQMNSKRTADEQQVNTNNKDKNNKKEEYKSGQIAALRDEFKTFFAQDSIHRENVRMWMMKTYKKGWTECDECLESHLGDMEDDYVYKNEAWTAIPEGRRYKRAIVWLRNAMEKGWRLGHGGMKPMSYTEEQDHYERRDDDAATILKDIESWK